MRRARDNRNRSLQPHRPNTQGYVIDVGVPHGLGGEAGLVVLVDQRAQRHRLARHLRVGERERERMSQRERARERERASERESARQAARDRERARARERQRDSERERVCVRERDLVVELADVVLLLRQLLGHLVLVPRFKFRVLCAGFRVPSFGLRVSGSGFRVPGFGFRVPGFGFRGWELPGVSGPAACQRASAR